MKNMKNAEVMLMVLQFFLLMLVTKPQIVANTDFLTQPTFTDSTLWNNYMGINFYLDEVGELINTTMFQRYILNSNLYINWRNNWAVNLKMPKGWFFNCTTQIVNNSADCTRELQGNQTFFQIVGDFAFNTALQPYWTFSLNNQMLDFTDSAATASFASIALQVYFKSGSTYHLEMMTQGDQAVANGMKEDPWNWDTYLEEAARYEEILYGLNYRGPGITMQADASWFSNLPAYFSKVSLGVFSIQLVAFSQLSQVTIDNVLNDNYTKGLLQRRLNVSDSVSYSSFKDYKVSISSIKFIEGDGVDGVTNSFAAALFLIDLLLETVIYDFYDIHWDSPINANSKQSIFDDPTTFEPSALYYGMLFSSLLMDGVPKAVVPLTTAGSSSQIKVWGLQTTYKTKVIVLNKDQNATLNGVVRTFIQSSSSQKMKCTYMKAQSITSKGADMQIGGFKYNANSGNPEGTYQTVELTYNTSFLGYEIPIKYAQACVCTISNSNLIVPVKDEC